MEPISTPSGSNWGSEGPDLQPAVVQDAATGRVLMVGWVNAEALRRTQETGLVHFWSRSRGRLWRKGETSGNVLRVVEIRADCDGDAWLIQALPAGPTCHTGRLSCFHRHPDGGEVPVPPGSVLHRLEAVVADRRQRPQEGSLTSRLFAAGPDEIAKKIGEEAVEVLLALRTQPDRRVLEEAADLLYMLTVGLVERGLGWDAVLQILAERRGLSHPP